jgi:Uma2 family endonuclease
MAQSASTPFVTYASYAEAEKRSDTKHEWHDGIVVAMAGGTPRHGALSARVTIALGAIVAGRPCQVFTSDVKVRIRPTRLGTHPDVSVVCGPLQVDDEDPDSIVNPVLLVEVLSDSTEGYDRGAKFAHYRSLPSVKAVLLVGQREPVLELFEKDASGTWRLGVAGRGETLRIEAIDGTLEVDAIYRAPLPD